MSYLLLACQLVLAVTLLLAATGKFLNATEFLAVLRLSSIPKILVMPIAVSTPIVEACLAIGLVLSTPATLPPILFAVILLFGVFTLWMITVYVRGLRLRCGCFGSGKATIGPQTIVRNALLLAFSVGGFELSLHFQSPLPVPSFWMIVSVFSLGMCLTLLRAFQQSKSALILSTAQLELAQQNRRPNSRL